jgi:hypothetical protein
VNLSVVEIRCPEPVLAQHSILSVTGNDRVYGRTLIRTADSGTSLTTYKIGSLVKYRCERGYKVVGEPLSTCEDSGKWSGDVPQCVCKLFPSIVNTFVSIRCQVNNMGNCGIHGITTLTLASNKHTHMFI